MNCADCGISGAHYYPEWEEWLCRACEFERQRPGEFNDDYARRVYGKSAVDPEPPGGWAWSGWRGR